MTHCDLEFLTSSAARRASNSNFGGAAGGTNDDGAESRMAAERVTDELLSARGNPRLEEKIMRRSLKLAPLPKGALSAPPEDDDDNENERVSERVHRSTRALRASVVASGDKMCGVPSAGGIPPEIEPGEKEGAKDDEGGTRRRRRLALTIQVMSMVAALSKINNMGLHLELSCLHVLSILTIHINIVNSGH